MFVIIRLDRIIQCFFLDCPIKLGNDTSKDIKQCLRCWINRISFVIACIFVFASYGYANDDFADKFRTYKDHVQSASAAFQKKDYAKAITNYSKAIEMSPFEVISYFNRGIALFKSGKEKHAEIDFDRVIVMDQRMSSGACSGGAGGDSLQVNTTEVNTTANIADTSSIDASIAGGSPDTITFDVKPNCIAPNMLKNSGKTDEYCLTYEVSAETLEWAACGTGSGAQIGGTPANTQVAYWTDSSTVAGSNDFAWDNSTKILTLRKDSASTYSAPRLDFVRWNASDYPNQYDYIGDWRFGGGPGGLGVQVVDQAETDWGASNSEAQLVVYARTAPT